MEKEKKLSVIVPVYNEEKTLSRIIEKVQKSSLNIEKEIIVVNDASKDGSKEIILDLLKKYDNIKYFEHEKNMGKGAAIRTGLKNLDGDFVVIQDGDLEYNPEDFERLLEPILAGKSDVVYGSRMKGKISGYQIPSHYYGNLFLSYITRILYNKNVTDMETCYKMMKKEVAESLNLKSNRFNVEPEITAKIIKKGYRLIEIPINYNSRSFLEGKKITWKDGLSAMATLLKYRFFD